MRKLELVQPCDFTPAFGAPTAEAHVLRCVGCNKTVHDLSSLTEAEAIRFLDQRAPGQCMRFRTVDERILFRDGIGSIVGRIAENARPMIAVASLALAACGSPDPGHSAASGRGSGAPSQEWSARGSGAPSQVWSASAVASDSASERGTAVADTAPAASAPTAPSAVASTALPAPSASSVASAAGAPSGAPQARAGLPPQAHPPRRTIVDVGGY